MGYVDLSVSVAPHATAYDEDYPTRNTEQYSNVLHNILQDMDDQGNWWLDDGVPSAGYIATPAERIHDMIEDVFDYAALGIANYRATGNPNLSKPTYTSVGRPGVVVYPDVRQAEWRVYCECLKMMYRIYYLWETEEDPLRIKDYIRDMLIAWPLQDVEIQLNEEAGKSLRVYPVWKDADI